MLGRAKPPIYWLSVITVPKAIASVSMVREIGYAKACVPKATRAGFDVEAYQSKIEHPPIPVVQSSISS